MENYFIDLYRNIRIRAKTIQVAEGTLHIIYLEIYE